jgi:hypothetical protein
MLSASSRVPLMVGRPGWGVSLPGAWSSSVIPASWNTPPLTSLKLSIQAPSSSKRREWGGMLPGEMPPISA